MFRGILVWLGIVKPWRELERDGTWDDKYVEKLKSEIAPVKKVSKQKTEIASNETVSNRTPRVLIWGQIQAGKSSFINSMASVDKGRFANLTIAGGSKRSLTKQLNICRFTNSLANITVLDVMGLERNGLGGLRKDDVAFLLKGNIKNEYEFNEECHISPENELFEANTSLAQRAYCNVLVVSARDVAADLIEEDMKTKLVEVQQLANDAGVPTILVLTKIDTVCTKIAKDVKEVYDSPIMRNVVQKAHEMFGISEMDIFPVKNYTKEYEMKAEMDILLLLAARHIVRYASDRIEAKISSNKINS